MKKSILLLISICSFCVLSGCGGGGSTPPPTSSHSFRHDCGGVAAPERRSIWPVSSASRFRPDGHQLLRNRALHEHGWESGVASELNAREWDGDIFSDVRDH